MAANYVCVKPCFINQRFRPGDVVEEEVATIVPKCFKALRSRTAATMEAEIEELIPEKAAGKKSRPKPITMSDIKGKTAEYLA